MDRDSERGIHFIPVDEATLRDVSLADELCRAQALLASGLVAVRDLHEPNWDLYPALFLLANGFERLLKVAICLSFLETTGSYPTEKEWRKSGCARHSPGKLLTILKARVPSQTGSVGRVLARATDGNTFLGRLVAILDNHSEAEVGRYFNLDVALGRRSFGRSAPPDMWDELAADHIGEYQDIDPEEASEAQMTDAYSTAINAMADELGLLAWAVAMLFAHRQLGEEGARISDSLQPFLQMRPAEKG